MIASLTFLTVALLRPELLLELPLFPLFPLLNGKPLKGLLLPPLFPGLPELAEGGVSDHVGKAPAPAHWAWIPVVQRLTIWVIRPVPRLTVARLAILLLLAIAEWLSVRARWAESRRRRRRRGARLAIALLAVARLAIAALAVIGLAVVRLGVFGLGERAGLCPRCRPGPLVRLAGRLARRIGIGGPGSPRVRLLAFAALLVVHLITLCAHKCLPAYVRQRPSPSPVRAGQGRALLQKHTDLDVS
jgi:hypothetical protein